MADIGFASQVGATAWLSGTANAQVSQAGLTAWLVSTVPGYVSQTGATVWIREVNTASGVSAGMLAHLACPVTTLCNLWKITATDGTIKRYCNHTRNLTYNSETYLAIPMRPTSTQMNANLEPGNAEIDAPLLLGGFEEDDLIGGKWDFARVEMLVVNYLDTSIGFARRHVGFIGEVTISNGVFRAEFRSMTELLNQPVGDLYQPLCPYSLGDADCKKDLTSFTHSGTVSAVDPSHPNSIFTVSVTQADDYFTLGKVTFTSGANNGLVMEIKKQIGNRLILARPMPNAITATDGVTLVAGDDKRRETCRDKFANAVNFGGFPELPGIDRVFKYPE